MAQDPTEKKSIFDLRPGFVSRFGNWIEEPEKELEEERKLEQFLLKIPNNLDAKSSDLLKRILSSDIGQQIINALTSQKFIFNVILSPHLPLTLL